MSSSTSATVPTPTSTSCGAKLYEIPVQDASCAVPYSKDYVDVMSKCCKSADVISYYDDCGLYCLAQDQSVADLTDCLFKEDAKSADVFCRGNKTATATATGEADIPATVSATVVESGSGDATKTKGSGDATKTKGSGDATKTKGSGKGGKGGKDDDDDGDDAKPTTSDSAAPGATPQARTSVLGVAVGTLLFSATVFGAVLV